MLDLWCRGGDPDPCNPLTGTDLSQDASCTLADGCYRLTTASAQNHAREGVSCTLCHQIEDDSLGSPASFSGGFSIAAAGDADAFTIYGPYPNPHAGGASLMQSNTGYIPRQREPASIRQRGPQGL